MKKRIVAILTVAALLCLGVVSGQAAGLFDFSSRNQKTVTISQAEYDRLRRYEDMDEILQYIESWYWQEPDTDYLVETAIRGMMAGLDDPYSFYYNKEEWEEMLADDEGVYGGVGMELRGSAETTAVIVTRLFENSPAKRAGILPGDLLVRVADIEVNIDTMQDAVDVMRGTLGESVEVEVKRGEQYLTYELTREVITINNVESAMLQDGVGYIDLFRFAGESEKEFAAALEKLKAQGAKSLVVDLRNNPGGWVKAAVEVADLFLDDDLLVYSQDRYGNKDEAGYHTKKGKDDIPLVMLVNGASASSSEILAGGLQDLGRATVVGTTTFGKGIIQTVVELGKDKGGFQMTYAQYFLPSGKAVHKIGITPDIVSEMPEELLDAIFDTGDLSDPQLRDAWEVAKGLIPAEQ